VHYKYTKSERQSYVSLLASAAAAAFLDVGFLVAAGLEEGLADALEAGLALTVADLGFAFVAVFFGLSADAFLAATFFVVVAFFAAGFLVVEGFFPTTAFFAGARLEATVAFFAGVALVLPARTFLGAGAFFAVGFAVPVAVFTFGLGFVAAATGLGLVTVFFAGVGLALDTGLEFSFVASPRTLGVSFTLPDGPLGRTNVPRSLPDVIARLSWLAVEAFSSTLYFFSTNFLIIGRETPPLASSGCAMIHSLIISIHEGWVVVLVAEALVRPAAGALAEDFFGAVGIGRDGV